MKLARSEVAKQSSLLFISNFFAAGLGFLAITLISRQLGPSGFGVFSVSTAVASFVAGFTDFGIGTALVKFVSQYMQSDYDRVKTFLRVSMKIEALIGFFILALGFIFAPYLAKILSPQEDLMLPVRMGILSGFGISMGAYISAILQARQEFLKLSSWMISASVLKAGMVIIISFVGLMTIQNALFVYVLVPIIMFVVGFILIPHDFISSVGDEKSVFSELFNFSKWIMLSFFATAVIGKIDVFMLAHYRSAHEVGIYSAAFQLSMVFPIFIGAISSVILPRVSRMENERDLVVFFKKSLLSSFFVVVMILPIFVGARYLLEVIFGNLYLESVDAFRILFVAFVVAIFINPVSAILLRFDRTKVLMVSNYAQLVVSVVANLILVPRYGGLGAAMSFLFVSSVGGLIILFSIIKEFKFRKLM